MKEQIIETADIKMTSARSYSAPELLPLKEASNRSGINYMRLLRLCCMGEIDHVKRGKRFFVNMADLSKYLKQH